MTTRRRMLLSAFGILAGISLFLPYAGAESVRSKEFTSTGRKDPMLNHSLPMVLAAGSDTAWVNVHLSGAACPGSVTRGGEATGGPLAAETWCFEGGASDTASVGPGPGGVGTRTYRFTHYDRNRRRDDVDSLYWRATTFQAVAGTRSMWCGGTNNRCGTWLYTGGGYGNFWNQTMQVSLGGPFNATLGCSLSFATRYVVERNYDYAYVEFKSRRDGKWKVIDAFNGRSGCTVTAPALACFVDWNNYIGPTKCPPIPFGTAVNYPQDWRGAASAARDTPWPYANNKVYLAGDSLTTTPASLDSLLIRWRFITDALWSAEEPGNPEAKGIWVDNVLIKVGGVTVVNQNFDALAENALPAAPFNFPQGDAVYDGWALRFDLDPPLEGYFNPSPGDSGLPSACELNASWQWSIAATAGGIPHNPANTGPYFFLETPTIPLNYSEGGVGPFSKPGVVWQYDVFQNILPETCDFTDTKVQVHKTAGNAWCPQQNIDGFVLYGGGTFWNIDLIENASAFTTQSGLDSVRFTWSLIDVGEPGTPCWDPGLPPHREAQFVVDNVSIGLIDGSATTFTTAGRSFNFQDTFNTHTCLYNANVANSDVGQGQYLLHDRSESLSLIVLDPDDLPAGNVELWYSTDSTSWTSKDMNLTIPDPLDPSNGGTYTSTVCDTPFTPGTQYVYYIRATDGAGNIAYFPPAANPTHDNYPSYFPVEILPTPGTKILLVDDFGRNHLDYHACRQDTVSRPADDAYEEILRGLGFGYMQAGGYDKYDVQGASSNQRINEPWGFRTSPPDSPQVGSNVYDVVIYTTGPAFNAWTIQDTTQLFLKEFVFDGGNVLITGDRILEDLTNPSTPVDLEFVPYVLGATYLGDHAAGFLNSDRFPRARGLGTILANGDSMHVYSGCDFVRPEMNKITVNGSGLPAWSHPGAYLLYEDQTAPYDSVAGIYNFVTFSPDTGKVVYLPFSLDALVNINEVTCDPPRSTPTTAPGGGTDVPLVHVFGRAELLRDILSLFGLSAPATSVAGAEPGQRFENRLYAPSPNPFNPQTKLRFSLEVDGPVSLEIFDVAGRKVRTLVNESRLAGAHNVLWDGRNGRGETVASGVYFAKMQTRSFTASEKLTLLK